MTIQAHTKNGAKAKSFGENIESDLALEFIRVVENAAIASARTMGQGERKLSDHVATEAMRHTMDTVPSSPMATKTSGSSTQPWGMPSLPYFGGSAARASDGKPAARTKPPSAVTP